MAMFCPLLSCSVRGPTAYSEEDDEDLESDDFDDGDEEVGMPLLDWNDPDWGFDDEEAQPEDGDFWFDSNDEENAL
jgi:hypothetical protein